VCVRKRSEPCAFVGRQTFDRLRQRRRRRRIGNVRKCPGDLDPVFSVEIESLAPEPAAEAKVGKKPANAAAARQPSLNSSRSTSCA